MTKDLVDTIVEKFLEEQESAHEENTLKIEIVEKSKSSSGEDDQGSKYLMIAKLQVGRQNDCEDKEDEISVKAYGFMEGNYNKEERKPPWWNSAEVVRRAKEALKPKEEQLRKEEDVKEQEQAAINVKALRNTLSTAVADRQL